MLLHRDTRRISARTMTDLNDSVIVCETLLSSKQRKTVQTKQKKQTIRTKKKTFYESPLRYIQLSGKRWEQQIKGKQKLNFNKGKQHEVENNENKFFSHIEANSLCQDNIIVLSDNECEFVNARDKDVYENKEETEKRFMGRLDKNSNGPLKCKKSPVLIRSKKRKSIFILDTEDSDTDYENIVPLDSINQNTDDIVVVWSSKSTDLSDTQTKKSDIVNEGTTHDNLINLEKNGAGTVNQGKRYEGKSGKETMVNLDEEEDTLEGEIKDQEDEAEGTTVTQAEDDRIFMIDCSPDPKNLHCLITGRTNKRNTEVNHDREVQIDDTDLLFNKAGLKLPFAQDISGTITIEKPKSFFNTLSKLEQKSSKLHKQDMQPNTSSVHNAALSSGSVTFPLTGLREIVIDGNNVAMAHTNGKSFSEKGLMIVIDYFRSRGHLVKVFVPQYRRSVNSPLLEKWYTNGVVVFTPSRYIAGKWITPYDDRYIIQYATMCKGIVISSDQFRDLYNENPEWRDTILNRLLAPTFIGDIVMFPEDPLGRKGPTLHQFLRH